jgi:hypothetical protein
MYTLNGATRGIIFGQITFIVFPLEYDEISGGTYVEATNHPAVGPSLEGKFPGSDFFCQVDSCRSYV